MMRILLVLFAAMMSVVLVGCSGAATPGDSDTAPSFTESVADQTYTLGEAINTLTLPAASGGNGTLSYSLKPTVPGLTFTAATHTLSGTPTSTGSYAMTYQVVDADANTAASDAATRTFTITVQSPTLRGAPTMLSLTASEMPTEGEAPGGNLPGVSFTPNRVTVTATLDQPAPSGGTTVTLVTGGTAQLGTCLSDSCFTHDLGDYTLAPTTFTIAAGQKAGTATITVQNDWVDDDDETIVIDASSVNPALTAEQLVLTIIDNNAPSAADDFMLSCPSPAEVAAIDNELELRFIDDPTAGDPLACSEDAGSVDLTVTQMGVYQTLRLLKGAMFSEPLPWTSESLWDWLVAAIDGIDFDSNVENSFCCRGTFGRTIVIRTSSTWISAYRRVAYSAGMTGVGAVSLYVHEARHAEGPPHTCGVGDDQTFAEMGAWAYVYYTWLWFEQKFVPEDFFGPELREDMSTRRTLTCGRICGGDCPG